MLASTFQERTPQLGLPCAMGTTSLPADSKAFKRRINFVMPIEVKWYRMVMAWSETIVIFHEIFRCLSFCWLLVF